MQLQKRRDEACGRSRRLQGLDKRGNEQLERCALVLAAANGDFLSKHPERVSQDSLDR